MQSRLIDNAINGQSNVFQEGSFVDIFIINTEKIHVEIMNRGQIKLLITCFLSCLWGLNSTAAFSFESYEHRRLGNTALGVTLGYFEYTRANQSYVDDDGVSISAVVEDKLIIDIQNRLETFNCGNIVQLVDYLNYPLKVLESDSHNTVTYAQDWYALNGDLLKENNEGFTLDLLRSSHNNEYHFQAGLFNFLLEFHRSALDKASKGELFAAATDNAIANHFLQDFFAPGHMIAIRENTHDAVSLGIHDIANRNGAPFIINQERWNQDLVPILEFLKVTLTKNPERYKLFFRDSDNDPETTQEIIAQLMSNHESLYVYGDDQLSYHPDQQLLMTLIEVRGNLDVLQAFEQSQQPGVDLTKFSAVPRNSLNSYTWSGVYDRETETERIPEAGIPYGKYDFTPELMSQSSNIVVLSLGGEAPTSVPGTSRLFVNAEVIPLALFDAVDFIRENTSQRRARYCDFVSICNIAPAIGVTYINDQKFSAIGPSFRIIKAIPKISTNLSLYSNYLNYSARGLDSDDKFSYGLRVDIGFSLYAAYIGFGKGYALDSNNSFQQEDVISFGLSFTLPTSRLW